MTKKYKLTEKHPTQELYRIQALRDFGDVKAGDLGGWIGSEENLSHSGKAWVYGNARVYENAEVYGDTWVSGNAQMSGNAKVFGNARVSGNTEVYGDARVFGDAWVYGGAEVFGDAEVFGNAQVSGDAWVYGDARVFGNAEVCGNTKLRGDMKLTDICPQQETKPKETSRLIIKDDSQGTTKEKTMTESLKAQAKRLRNRVQPYERYLVMAAILVALDHFVLKGKLRGKIQELGSTLGNKLASMIDKAIGKIGE